MLQAPLHGPDVYELIRTYMDTHELNTEVYEMDPAPQALAPLRPHLPLQALEDGVPGVLRGLAIRVQGFKG